MPAQFWRVAAITAALVFTLAPVSWAVNPVTFEFTAQVKSVIDMGDLPANTMGSMIGGRYTFDGDTVAATMPPGLYPDAMRFFAEVDIEGQLFEAVSPVLHPSTLRQIVVHDFELDPLEGDSYKAQMFALPPSLGDLKDFEIQLTSATQSSAIVGTDLPLVPPILNQFASAEVGLVTQSDSVVIADLITLPEPTCAATTIATGVALSLLASRRRVGEA